MGRVTATFDGGVVAEPESFSTTSGAHGIRFPVYVNDEDKKDGSYQKNGDVTKIRVTLWNDVADAADIQKGDIVEVVGTIKERAYEGANGAGRSLETKFVDSVVVKYRQDAASGAASGKSSGGFIPAGFQDGFTD